MKIMSAGWRMAYLKKSDGKECIFCVRPGRGSDRANLIVYRGKHAFVMMNRYPYSTGHLMVAPYRHVAGIAALTDDEACETMSLVGMSESALKAALSPDGFNMGINVGKCAGAGYPGHVHVHIVPRWSGDTNFMPVISETKVLPETLTDTYGRIMKAARAILDGRLAPPGRGPSKRPRGRR